MFGTDVKFLQRFLKSASCFDGDCTGVDGPATQAALAKFQGQCTTIADELGRFDERSEKSITTLHPRAQKAAREFLGAVAAADLGGATVKIISGTRTYAEQADLYAQGRTKKGDIVTKADAGRSNHNFGIAWDVGIFNGSKYLTESPLYAKVGAIGQSLGLEWGGTWKTIHDEPHFQLQTEYKLADVRDRFESGSAFV